MVIDSSALMAIFFDEPERHYFNTLIDSDPSRLISAPTVLETEMVLSARFREAARAPLDEFLHTARLEIVAFDAQQARIARTAFRLYGKGRHGAGLNFGDCFSYALAKVRGEPLLYKGGDFAQTDIRSAL